MLDSLLQLFTTAFHWAPPELGLSLLAVLTTCGVMWVWSKTSNQARMRAQRNRAWAALLELRVYADEPRMAGRSLRALLGANLGCILLAVRPALFTLLPMTLLLVHLDRFYGHAPLPVGQDAVVTLHTPAVARMSAPPQIEITSPPVRAEGEISWRIRPIAPVSGELIFETGGPQLRSRVEAGGAWRVIPAGTSTPAVEVGYPEAPARWLCWYFATSLLTVLLLKRRFGVMI